jgi:hypothetical protein
MAYAFAFGGHGGEDGGGGALDGAGKSLRSDACEGTRASAAEALGGRNTHPANGQELRLGRSSNFSYRLSANSRVRIEAAITAVTESNRANILTKCRQIISFRDRDGQVLHRWR